MPDLNPSPDSLHLASPALGPWFRDDAAADPDLPIELPPPSGDLSVALPSLAVDAEWRTPAGATRSYRVATPTRPAALRALRSENGGPAFTDGSLVVLLTLLPEVEVRLWALTQPIPAPDGTAVPPANTPARPRIRYLAMEVPASAATDIGAIESLRPATLPSDLTTEADRAGYLGLTSGAGLGNQPRPSAELLRPGDGGVALRNRTGAPLAGLKLWCFDDRGRPLDPGAVATWWTFLCSTGVWDNLWHDTGATDRRTTRVTAAKTVHVTSASEGPLEGELKARLDLTDLTLVTGSETLYRVGASPAVALTSAPDPDDAPLPRIAALPLGSYADPSTATPFAGWTGSAWPTSLTRDFARLGFLDLERHIVGLTRSDDRQASARTRVSPARNTATAPLLATTDAVSSAVMTTLNAGAGAAAMSPVMDTLWGASTPPSGFGTDPLPDALAYTVHALVGEGVTSAGGSVSDQKIAFHFEAGALPAAGWIRVWTHGLDTVTGLRFRQDGGAGLADASGEAWVVTAIPDGTGAPSDPNSDPVRLSFDALVVADGQSRYFAEERYERPATAPGSPVALPAPPDDPAGFTLWVCEQGSPLTRGGAQYRSGQTVLALPTDPVDPPALVDLTTLDASDVAADTLLNAPGSDDALVVTTPAFAQAEDGTLDPADVPGGASLVRRTRNLLSRVDGMGQPVPTQERREVAAWQPGSTGVVGATPGRAPWHETPPPQLGHAGVPAGPEIHGPGTALSGPAADRLRDLMTERRSADLEHFIEAAGAPVTPTADPGGTTAWTAVLETTTHGIVGDAVIRAFLAAATFMPGQTWQTIKNQIQAIVPDAIDDLVDTSTFDDDALAAAFDRMIVKTRDGAKEFATALLAALGRAEDFVYMETPALDALTAESGGIDLVGALEDRWSVRPGLRVMLAVPEKYLPGQPSKLEEIRVAGIRGALKRLSDAGGDRIVLFSPAAGPGRPWHVAATTVVVDDALLLTGTTHLWRRGLTFDTSLSVGLFDENVTFGRPAAVRAARLQLQANALGLPVGLLPDDPEDCLSAIQALNAAGGLGRVRTGVFPPRADTTSSTDLDAWNPDGRPGIVADWILFFAGLSAGDRTEIENAVR